MFRRNRLNAVATTALVAAFPVFPLFADEPTAKDDAATQAVATAETGAAQTFELPDLNAAFADFNVSLLEIPDGESVEFYRERAAALQVEPLRFVLPKKTGGSRSRKRRVPRVYRARLLDVPGNDSDADRVR